MKTTGEDVRSRIKWPLLVGFITALSVIPPARAQSLVGTNWHDLVEQAYSGEHSLYLPWDWPGPGQWRAFSLDGGEPAWVSSRMLQDCGNLGVTNLQVRGVTATPVVLTEFVLTGEALVQSPGLTNIILRVAAPGSYMADASPRLGVFREWSQATNCPDCWGLTASDIPPPTVTFEPLLIANIADYSVYASNLETESAAAASSTTASGRGLAMGARIRS